MVKVDKENSLFLTGVVIANGIKDSDGDILNKKDIKKLISSYLSQKTDTNHDFLENYGVKIIENYISKVEETIGDKTVPVGSWICKMMVWDENLIRNIRQGRLNGLSLASQPDSDVKFSKDELINKRSTYRQFKDVEVLTPTFISIVNKPANGFDFDYYSYKSYITKNKEMEVKSLSEENETNQMGVLANKLLDVVLNQNNVLNEKLAVIKSVETEENKAPLTETIETEPITKAAPPQGGIAPQQPQGQPQYGQPVSLEMVNQKLDHILSIIGGGQQPMKSDKKCEKSEEDVVEKEEKTNDETKEPTTEGNDSHNTGEVAPSGKSDVKPSTETEGEVPSSGKKKHVLKSEAPKTEHIENVNSTSNVYEQTYINPIKGTPRDYLGRPIR